MQRKSFFEAKSESFFGLATQFLGQIIARDWRVSEKFWGMKASFYTS
jgi:hypothetical protein